MATFGLSAVPGSLPAKLQTASQQCRSGILIDWSSKEILWAKNPDSPVEIASMTKMMTALLLMEALKDHRVNWTDRVPVTPAAAKIGGSQVWLDPKESFTIEELAKCVMIKSANDAAYLLGEHLGGGDTATFVAAMNKRAADLGCSGMRFYNAHGLPTEHKGPENQATPREMALLAARLLEYPDLMQICGIKQDYIRKDTPKPTTLFNHNTLISKRNCPGVDGMKTGLTDKSGHCVTATCLRNGRRMILVLTGFPKSDRGLARDHFAAGLFDWAYGRQATAAAGLPATAPAASAVSAVSATPATAGTAAAALPAGTAAAAQVAAKPAPAKKKPLPGLSRVR